MVHVELTILGIIPLGVRIFGIIRPLNGVSHALHDDHDLNRLNIEVVLGDMGLVYLRDRVLT